MGTHWNWRLASRLSVITLAVLVVLTVALLQQQRSHTATPAIDSPSNTTSSALQGSDLGGTPAPNFSLTDQAGKQISLAQFKGSPVILTFLYTNCPDQCPLTAEKLHSTVQMLGQNAQHVSIIAVSTDPKRDTTAAAMNFSKAHNMQDYWHYLVGTRQSLGPVWASYHIFAQPQQQTVNHSLGIYLIDKQGRERIFMNSDFTPSQLTANLNTLLKE
jgi:protein SCO1